MFIKLANRSRAYAADLRRMFPNVSISDNPDDATLSMLGYARVQPTPQPEGDVVTEGQPEQRDGQWYQTWEVREFTAEEIEAQRKASVPSSVTMRQARLALLGTGLLDGVEEALSTLEGAQGQAARIEWEYSQEVWRNKPFVNLLGQSIGLSDEDIDELFLTAAQID